MVGAEEVARNNGESEVLLRMERREFLKGRLEIAIEAPQHDSRQEVSTYACTGSSLGDGSLHLGRHGVLCWSMQG